MYVICMYYVQWPAKRVSHHLNVSVQKALITHLDFDVTQKCWLIFFAGRCRYILKLTIFVKIWT
jgi:hypothetical protein